MPRRMRVSRMPYHSMFRYFKGAKWPRGAAPRPPNCMPTNKDSLWAGVSTLVVGPLPGLLGHSVKTIKEAAERELYLTKEARLRGALLEVEIRFERGEISEEEYQRRVAQIKKSMEELSGGD